MSLGEIAAGLVVLGVGVKPMVKPHIPFSPFDFKFIKFWGLKRKLAQAAAGAAIDETIYTVKQHEMVLLLSVGILTQKTTGTAFRLFIIRKQEVAVPKDWLINEDSVNNEWFTWPPGKTPSTDRVLAWHMLFLHEGDKIDLTHALTAAETIADDVHLHLIEYADPRYKE